jgi:Domain of unknown function (DUF222)
MLADPGVCEEAEYAGSPQGLAWSWQIDLEDLLAAVTVRRSQGVPDGPEVDQEAVLEAEAAAVDAGQARTLEPAEIAGRAAGRIPPGPGLAALLASAAEGELPDHALADAAADFRRLASWAQAWELACVAQIAARSAARDPEITVGADGRPEQISRSACAQVSLALALTGVGAQWWTELAVALSWRLAKTGDALRAGMIDLTRARLIADATSLLDDDAARAVEAQILPGAGDKTTGMLRAALRRAVIAADPDGAERRRAEAERRAQVVLYPEEESTAMLAGQGLPGVHAAAAMARIKAMARALRAAGAAGSLDLLCAQVFLGILLGTLPPIPPPDGAPPDEPPEGPRDGGEPGPGGQADVPWPEAPTPGGDDDDPGPDEPPVAPDGEDEDWADNNEALAWPELPSRIPPGLAADAGDGSVPGATGLLDLALPWATLAGTAAEPGWLSRLGPITPLQARGLADLAAADPATQWRIIVTGSGGQAIATTRISRPGPGQRAGPGRDARLGQREGPGQAVGGGLVSRVTLIIPEAVLGRDPPGKAAAVDLAGVPEETAAMLAAALRAAARASARAAAATAADAAAGGCAHLAASTAYRPPPTLRDHVAARDLTCRFPTCRQPAWRGDLDHTIPHQQGGMTCGCNLGGLCRAHHLVKQHPGWTLRQPAPGIFAWTTPAGHTYTVTPDTYLL